jgi:hypothetical protein
MCRSPAQSGGKNVCFSFLVPPRFYLEQRKLAAGHFCLSLTRYLHEIPHRRTFTALETSTRPHFHEIDHQGPDSALIRLHKYVLKQKVSH